MGRADYTENYRVTNRTPFLSVVAAFSMLVVLVVAFVVLRRSGRGQRGSWDYHRVDGRGVTFVGGANNAGVYTNQCQHRCAPSSNTTTYYGSGSSNGGMDAGVRSVAGMDTHHRGWGMDTQRPSQAEGDAVLSPRRGRGPNVPSNGNTSNRGRDTRSPSQVSPRRGFDTSSRGAEGPAGVRSVAVQSSGNSSSSSNSGVEGPAGVRSVAVQSSGNSRRGSVSGPTNFRHVQTGMISDPFDFRHVEHHDRGVPPPSVGVSAVPPEGRSGRGRGAHVDGAGTEKASKLTADKMHLAADLEIANAVSDAGVAAVESILNMLPVGDPQRAGVERTLRVLRSDAGNGVNSGNGNGNGNGSSRVEGRGVAGVNARDPRQAEGVAIMSPRRGNSSSSSSSSNHNHNHSRSYDDGRNHGGYYNAEREASNSSLGRRAEYGGATLTAGSSPSNAPERGVAPSTADALQTQMESTNSALRTLLGQRAAEALTNVRESFRRRPATRAEEAASADGRPPGAGEAPRRRMLPGLPASEGRSGTFSPRARNRTRLLAASINLTNAVGGATEALSPRRTSSTETAAPHGP